MAPTSLATVDIPHAPIIFFESAPALAYFDGTLRITLSTIVTLPTADGKTTSQDVVACYLRCGVHAARHLRDTLDKALLLSVPAQHDGKTN